MYILDLASKFVDGAKNVGLWVGSGGQVVSQGEAQARADVCLTCPENRHSDHVTKEVALATKKFLEFKNDLELRVNGEKRLHHCTGCGCVIRLMVWQPQALVKSQMTGEEMAVTPKFCWKLKP